MKLNRLESTTQHHTAAPRAPDNHAAAEPVRRVAAMEGIESDRQRSLQQEVAEFDQKVIGPFEGGERVLQEARAVVAQLAALGPAAGKLIKGSVAAGTIRGIDDAV